MKNAGSTGSRTASFTLAELLVATAMISAITALILPALSDANAKFRAEYCLNNLKQWGVGFQLYAADFNGYLPAEGSSAGSVVSFKECWFNGVPPYLKLVPYKDYLESPGYLRFGQARLWVCPEKNLRNAQSTSGLNSFSYGMNNYLDGDNIDDAYHHLRHVKLSSISNPDTTVLLCDIYANAPACDPLDVTFQTYPWQKYGAGLHQNGANFLFVDGHVSWFPVSAYWTGSTGITNNPALRWHP